VIPRLESNSSHSEISSEKEEIKESSSDSKDELKNAQSYFENNLENNCFMDQSLYSIDEENSNDALSIVYDKQVERVRQYLLTQLK